jgi:hypothetical protein
VQSHDITSKCQQKYVLENNPLLKGVVVQNTPSTLIFDNFIQREPLTV